jgi:repressor LexA
MHSDSQKLNERVGKKIKLAREYKGYSQQQVANKLGLTQQTVSWYELGKRSARVELLNDLADICEVPFYFFLFDLDNDEVGKCLIVLEELPPDLRKPVLNMLQTLVSNLKHQLKTYSKDESCESDLKSFEIS